MSRKNPVNKIKKGLFATLICISMTGCGYKNDDGPQFKKEEKKTKISKETKKQVKNVEAMRIATDASTWYLLTKDYNKNKQAYSENKDKSIALIVDYLDGVYQIAYSRVSNDYSNELPYDYGYIEYLTLLKTYCEYYEADIQSIYDKLQADDAAFVADKAIIAEKRIENYYNSYLLKEKQTTKKSKNIKTKKEK